MSVRIEGPAVDTSILMFGLRNTAGTRRALTSFASAATGARGLAIIEDYVAKNPGRRSVAPLVRSKAAKAITTAAGLSLPDDDGANDLDAVQCVQLESPGDAPDLIHALEGDADTVDYCEHPAILYPQLPPSSAAAVEDDGISDNNRQWGMQQCGFPSVWEQLEVGDDPGSIAVIDMGSVAHDDLAQRVKVESEPQDPSRASHAMEVSGVIGARRGDDNGTGMSGCCAASLAFFNAWTTAAFDSRALYSALEEVARRRFPVLNLSLGSPVRDRTLERLIRACVRAGVVVVAAVGDDEEGTETPIFPAALPDVIAVGGTERFSNRTSTSKKGEHVWIAAPAEKIWTLSDNNAYDFQRGTSFAAPMVSAAVWLARRARPCMTPAEVRELLARAVDEATAPVQPDIEVGHGRLDVVRLAQLLKTA